MSFTQEEYDKLQEELKAAKQTIKEQDEDIYWLRSDLFHDDVSLSKYDDLDDILSELLAAERMADELERLTDSELAYEIWHTLRNVTASLHPMVNTVSVAVRV